MQNARRMGVLHGVGRLRDVPHESPHGRVAQIEFSGEASPFDQVHREVDLAVRFADVVHPDNAGVVGKPRGRLRLALKPGDRLRARIGAGQDHLERKLAFQILPIGAVHHAHGPPPQLAAQFVGTNPLHGSIA